MTKVIKRITCRLCNSPDLELGCPIKPTPIAEKYGATKEEAMEVPVAGLDLYRCGNCGHIQVLDVVDGSYLFGDDYTYRSAQTGGIVQHFQNYADTAWKRWDLAKGDLVVEIGSNDGTLLKEFKDRGAVVLGIDPASTISAEANARGIETLVDFFTPQLSEQIKEERGPAKLVVANNVFAHADDLRGIAAGISKLLTSDGIFMFEVSYLMDVFDKCLLGTIFHEHLSYHALEPMLAFLRQHDMEIVDVQRVGIQGGSIIVSAKKAGGPQDVADNVNDLLLLEKQTNLNTREKISDFAKLLDRLYDETHAFVVKTTGAGETMGGFGAARSGTTLIAQLELADTIQWIFDNHPAKVGRFSAGFGIPVFLTDEIATLKPDCLFILAWIHAKKIMETNSSYLEGGGKWVTCVPRLDIVGA